MTQAISHPRFYGLAVPQRVFRLAVKRARFLALWTVQDGLCAYCGEPMDWRPPDADCRVPADREPTFDHVIPRCRNGSWGAENIVLACGACNAAKGCEDWRPIGRVAGPMDRTWASLGAAQVQVAEAIRGMGQRLEVAS